MEVTTLCVTEKCKPFPVPVHGKKDLKLGTLKQIERLSGSHVKNE